MSLAKVNAFLETKVGFWIVTSILAGAATTLNAYLQTNFAERQRSALLVQKLDLEIAYRLSEFMVAMSQMTDQSAKPWKLKPTYTPEDVKAVTQSLVGPPKSIKDLILLSMYPKDFGERPLASLMAELEAELKTPGAFKDQLTYVSGGRLFEGDDWKGRSFGDTLSLASSVNRNLFQKRWRNSFYYMDCSADSPLC